MGMDRSGRLRHRNRSMNPIPRLLAGNIRALLVIDLQYGDAHADYVVLRRMRERGDEEIAAYYIDRLETLISGNARGLQDVCRGGRHRGYPYQDRILDGGWLRPGAWSIND